jgi:aspartate kinase
VSRIFKFGGTSVADAERIGQVAALVAAEQGSVVVVVSALAGVTDLLVALTAALARGGDIEEMLGQLEARHRDVAAALGVGAGHVDHVLSALRHPETRALPGAERDDAVRAAGEDLAAPLVAAALTAAGREARPVDARAVIRTDAAFGRAVPDEEAIVRLAAERLAPLLAQGVVPVVQGFVGATADGRTTTLGRGGSDFTATLLGAALAADEVHIWTDVDGVLSGDPRAVGHPRILEVLGFEEAVELAYFGAKVLHAGAAKHAVSRGLQVRIRNTFSPAGAGTRIARERWGAAEIAAVAFKPGVALIQVRSHPQAMPYGFLARVFEVLARHKLPVDLVATSHTSTAFTLDATAEVGEVARELEAFADVEAHTGLATITVVGHGLMDEPGINARVFDAVAHTPVQLISQASDVSLSLVVAEADAPDLVRRLHATLIDERVHAP